MQNILRFVKFVRFDSKSAPTSTQKLIRGTISSVRYSEFAEDLCGAFVAADIPLYKIRNKNVKDFLEKYAETQSPV